MNISIACTKCGIPSPGNSVLVYDMPIRDDDVYRFKCHAGHTNTVILEDEKFETLFSMAIQAIANGHTRDAVASGSASVERFQEFYIRIALSSRRVAMEMIESAWRQVRNMSERQLGMFTGIYLLIEQRSPLLVPTKMVEFRNEVIHKGKIPTRDEAKAFLNSVLNVISPILHEAQRKFPEEISHSRERKIKTQKAKWGDDTSSFFNFHKTLALRRRAGDIEPNSIDEELESLENHRRSLLQTDPKVLEMIEKIKRK